MPTIMKFLRTFSLPFAFALALVGTLGSLYAQHLGYEPCVLCWWQRIFLYPLVLLIPIGIWKQDRNIALYALPLAALGGLVALYHTLLYYAIIPEALAPCAVSVPCTQHLPSLFGINLITGSLITFILIIIFLVIEYRGETSMTITKNYGAK
jgi:disulfide bond formation protein DsbB